MTITAPTEPRSVFADDDPFSHYEADLSFTGILAGGSPADPKLVEGWLAKNLGVDDEEQLREWTRRHLAEVNGIDPTAATNEEIEAAIEANASEKKAQVFKRIDGRPYVEPRHIKALLKEATNIAFPRGTEKWGTYTSRSAARRGQEVGGKAPVDYIAERVFPLDAPIIVADEITGVELAVGHPKDPRTGEKRPNIGYYEYVEQPTITVAVRILDNCLTDEQIARIWGVAEANGLGARRSQGCGQFVVTRWERLD
jgi:hypothetical protein